ncbi:uncharacterized protein LOC124267451 [Haliotis rubra]|uniref:uncharacterized protein LOC124267451 n=1 Tax=Haliotis rubra TaxID=36100 RepID=UPI001EE4F348|nr:uncharacterized protein LOC124267451 [Haliotis rubra]
MVTVGVEVQSVLNHLAFLEEVDKQQEMIEGSSLQGAIERYSRYWLPLASKHPEEVLAAPLDIEWVWHCHMLVPLTYQEDCISRVGQVVPHKHLDPTERKEIMAKTQDLWDKAYPGVPFLTQPMSTNAGPAGHHISRVTSDIVSTSAKHRQFYYQVSLPHYRDKQFILKSFERYKKFIHLQKMNPSAVLAPAVDIDLIWQTHLLDPLDYRVDTERILGHLLDYDISIYATRDMTEVSNAEKLTRTLWEKEFVLEKLDATGAVYRGDPAKTQFTQLTDEETASMSYTSATIRISTLKLNCIPKRARAVELDFSSYYSMDSYHSKEWSNKNAMEWTDPDLATEDVSLKHCRLTFSLTGIQGKSFLKKEFKFRIGNGVFDTSKYIHAMTGNSTSFEETVPLLPSPVQLLIAGTMSNPRKDVIAFKLERELFKPVEHPNDEREEIWGPVPLPVPKVADAHETCYMATHTVAFISGEPVFTCKVIHSTDVMMSAVYVYYREKLVTCAHLIGPDQLPHPDQVRTDSAEKIPCLNPQSGERAVLIKNNRGDWGIVTGSWTGVDERALSASKGEKRRRRRRNAVPTSPGKLTYRWYNIPKKRLSFHQLDYKSGLMLRMGDVVYDDGHVMLYDGDEVAEHLALVLSVGLLVAMCQPRQRVWDPVWKEVFTTLLGEETPLVGAAGATQPCASNFYIVNTHKKNRASRDEAPRQYPQRSRRDSNEDRYLDEYEHPYIMGIDSCAKDCCGMYELDGDVYQDEKDYDGGGCGGGSDGGGGGFSGYSHHGRGGSDSGSIGGDSCGGGYYGGGGGDGSCGGGDSRRPVGQNVSRILQDVAWGRS